MASPENTTDGERAGDAVPAGEAFVWIPEAAGLNGRAFVADAVHFADYDRIVTDPESGTVAEGGYLPVVGFSLAGHPVEVPGLNDPGGGGWGAYMRTDGAGTAVVSPFGTPGAVYDQVDYEIVGFNGLATYGFGEDGGPFVEGAIDDLVTLLAGSLLSGTVTLVPTEAGLTIEGDVSLAVDEVAPGFALGRLDVLNLNFVHPPGDYSLPSPTTIRVAASGTSATFAAEDEPIDWDAIAARVFRAFEETGRWFDPGEPTGPDTAAAAPPLHPAVSDVVLG